MSDSGQNFLNLLFGGINQGIGEARRQQDQHTNLLLTIQQLMQRQREAQANEAFRQKEFTANEAFRQKQYDFQRAQAQAQTNRQFGIDLQNSMQQSVAVGMEKRRRDTLKMLATKYPQYAAVFEGALAGVPAAALGDLASASGKAGNSLTGSPIFDAVLQRSLTQMFTATDPITGNPIPIDPASVDALIKNVTTAAQRTMGTAGVDPNQPIGPPKPTEAIYNKMQDISTRKQAGSKQTGNLSVDEALTAVSEDKLFGPPQPGEQGVQVQISRARDLLDEGFINIGTFKAILERLGAADQVRGERLKELFTSAAIQNK